MFQKLRNRICTNSTIWAAVILCFTAWTCTAATIVDSVGFESPFTSSFMGTGQLAGQVPGAPLPIGTWQTSGSGSTAIVQTSVFAPGGGSQAVRVDRGSNSFERWAVPVSGFPIQPVILVDWDMRVEQSASGAFGPFFGSETYDNVGSLGLLASWGVDATTGEVLYQQSGTGFFIAPGPTVNFGAWNHFQIKLDYTAHQFTVSLNGVAVATDTFVDDVLLGGLNEFSDADISSLSAGGDPDSLAATGTAYFDNFRVTEAEAVPEPATFLLGGLGLAGLALWSLKRRRAARVGRSSPLP